MYIKPISGWFNRLNPQCVSDISIKAMFFDGWSLVPQKHRRARAIRTSARALGLRCGTATLGQHWCIDDPNWPSLWRKMIDAKKQVRKIMTDLGCPILFYQRCWYYWWFSSVLMFHVQAHVGMMILICGNDEPDWIKINTAKIGYHVGLCCCLNSFITPLLFLPYIYIYIWYIIYILYIYIYICILYIYISH